MEGLTATVGVFALVLVFGAVLFFERYIDKVKTNAKKVAMMEALGQTTKLAG